MAKPGLRQLDDATPPSFVVPKGACDCHAHVFGDPAVYPFNPERSYTPPEASTSAYRRLLTTLGLERAVIVQPSVYGFDNRCTLAAVAELGLDRARAVAMFDASAGDEELRRLDAAGVRGVRFITLAKGGAPLDQLQTVARRVAPLGWHIQMYVAPRTWAELAPTIRSLPVPVVMDHMAQVAAGTNENDSDLKAILRLLESGRTWIKLSAYRVSQAGPPFRDTDWLAALFLRTAPERCVWGTDWPHPDLSGYMPDDGRLLDLLAEWAPDAATRERVLVRNPARLYGFGEA